MIIEFGKLGMSKSEIASEFKVNRRTLNNWKDDTSKPEFMAAHEQYETELDAYCQRTLREIAEGKVKGKQNVAAHIYRMRVLLGQKYPEYLIDLTKSVKHETQATPTQVRDELKKILTSNSTLLSFLLENNNGTDTPNQSRQTS